MKADPVYPQMTDEYQLNNDKRELQYSLPPGSNEWRNGAKFGASFKTMHAKSPQATGRNFSKKGFFSPESNKAMFQTSQNFLARRHMRTIDFSDEERIQNTVAKNNYCDGVPSQDINVTFGKVIRPRQKTREVGKPGMYYSTQNDMDRLNETLRYQHSFIDSNFGETDSHFKKVRLLQQSEPKK